LGELDRILAPLDDETKHTVMLEVQNTMTYPPLTRETIIGASGFSAFDSSALLQRGDYGELDLHKIDNMMATGQIAYPMAMKKAPIISIVHSTAGFEVESPDERMKELFKENLLELFPRIIDEVLTFLEYGAYYGEVTWEPTYPQEFGLTKSAYPYWTIEDFHAVHPSTVSKILYDDITHEFQGFVQKASWKNQETVVGLDRALVIPNNGTFGNMAGVSVLEPVYVWWFWYELIWRSFLRFLQRAGVGVVLVKAPSRGRVMVNNREVPGIDWGLQLAASLHRTNYAVIPSDTDRDSNAPLWAVEYLKTGERGETEQFVSALDLLEKNIRRYLLTGGAEEGDEFDVMIDTERTLGHIGNHIGRYVLRKGLYFNNSFTRKIGLGFQGANTRVLPLLFKLMAVAGNTTDHALRNVDWRQLFTKGGVPVLSEEEVEEKLKEEIAEELARSKQQGEPGEKAKLPPGGEGRWASTRDKEGQAEALELAAEALNASVTMLTRGQVEELERLGVLADDSPIVVAFNPWHDTKGLFTDKAHASKPLPKGSYQAHGKVGDRAEFRVKDAASYAFEKTGDKPLKVNAYRKQGEYVNAVCGKGQILCRKTASRSLAAYTDKSLHIGPRGLRTISTNRKTGEYILMHEAFHATKRSDGKFGADVSFTKFGDESYRRAMSRKYIEEGTTDLLARRALGVNESYWPGGVGGAYKNYMGAIAILTGRVSGWNRDDAWRLVEEMHSYVNDEMWLRELLTNAFGEPEGGWTSGKIFIMMQRLQHAAKWNQWRALGWIFGKSQTPKGGIAG